MARAACENFANWLENKALSRKGIKSSVSAKSMADGSAKFVSSEGKNGKAAGKRAEYHAAADAGEKL